MSDQSAPQEIVIVRRRGGGEDEGHHGGAWKIAYADFMTAMMAFFLVMWLVNAADKKVLTQVASYFNPLRMSERVSAKKGVEDLVQGSAGQTKAERQGGKGAAKGEGEQEDAEHSASPEKPAAATEKAEKKSSGEGGQTDFTEQELFNDPYGILEKLASQAIVGRQGGSESHDGTGKSEVGGDAFRDPFDPEFNRVPDKKANADLKTAESTERAVTNDPQKAGATKDQPASNPAQDAAKSESPPAKDAESANAKADKKPAAQSKEQQQKAEQLGAKLQAALADLVPGQKPTLSVQATPEGLLVSLTDEFDFEMFKVSSAEPNKQLVAAIKRVSGVLKPMSGKIVIRGHTDGRPFVKGTSDNWKLSAQRALMTRYMLISGGVDEKRIERIEGYAESTLKVTADPLAAQNRRIELLLRQ